MGAYVNNTSIPGLKVNSGIIPTGTYLVTGGKGIFDVYSYSSLSVDVIDLLDAAVTVGLTITSYDDLSASKINATAFTTASMLETVNMPGVKSIGSFAFQNCSNLKAANFPICSTIGENAFRSCYKLTTANFPSCTVIKASAFQNCSTLSSVSFPNLPSMSFNYCFGYCYNLPSIYLPICSSLGYYTFYCCSNLSAVSLPSCTHTGYGCFYSCSKLTSVSMPMCSYVGQACFANCYTLSTISLPACVSFSTQAFSGCYNLLSVYLNVSEVPSLANVNVFASTPISNYTTSTGGVYGSIFVPTSLYSSFISATNWANYSSRIVSMNF